MTALGSKYFATIGIECHVQLKTNTKLFSAVGNDARQAPPNTLVSHIDFGMPGALPVLNKEAVRLAAKAAFALNSVPQKFSKFDRKHYFYPDLPMGYQISQFDEPIILGGSVDIAVIGTVKTIGVTRAHLEADAGKSTHPAGQNYSLVDLNRAGTPLLEIVSEPDMHTAAEAKAYAKELYLAMRYAGVSDANLFYGNMRFDVNVSISTDETLGTRTETKNINSFRAVERVVEFEIARQTDVIDAGGTVVQETRGWDDDKLVTFTQRSKENADDYRYMPDPDLPPIVLDEKYIETIKAEMPALPAQYRKLLKEIGIDDNTTEDIIAAPDSAIAVKRIYNRAGADHAKRVAYWLLMMVADENDNSELLSISDDQFIELSQLVSDGKLSSTAAKEVLAEIKKNGGNPVEIAESMNILQESDEAAITSVVNEVLANNPKAAQDVKSGELKAIGFLTGQVMKASQGKANPALAPENNQTTTWTLTNVTWLILINGAPGSGKNDLSKWLAPRLQVPVLSKESIKEFLFDNLGYKDRTWSRILGRASNEMLYDVAAEFLAADESLLIESDFWPEYALQRMQTIVSQSSASVLEIYCYADDETRMERFRERADSGLRHPGHVDNLATLRDDSAYGPLGIGELVQIDTTNSNQELYTYVHEQVLQLMNQSKVND